MGARHSSGTSPCELMVASVPPPPRAPAYARPAARRSIARGRSGRPRSGATHRVGPGGLALGVRVDFAGPELAGVVGLVLPAHGRQLRGQRRCVYILLVCGLWIEHGHQGYFRARSSESEMICRILKALQHAVGGSQIGARSVSSGGSSCKMRATSPRKLGSFWAAGCEALEIGRGGAWICNRGGSLAPHRLVEQLLVPLQTLCSSATDDGRYSTPLPSPQMS